MEKFSATYGNTAKNFVIQNITGEDARTEYEGVICIIKNILQRGTPTPPSEYLKARLGEMVSPINEPLRMISTEEHYWNSRIKGSTDDRNNNPAEEFFNVLIPEYFGDYAFVRSLILPEAEIEEIAPTKNNEFIDRQVDFYLPQAKLVIEIDGTQHQKKLQSSMDLDRDRHLKKNGIKVVRISTISIRNRDQDFLDKIKEILKIVEASNEVLKYQIAVNQGNQSSEDLLRIHYDSILRLQLLLLTLLRKNRLNFNMLLWEFTIVDSTNELEEILGVAIADLFLWIDNICKLIKLPFIKPTVSINPKRPSDSGVVIDFHIKKRWTDEAALNRDVIYIRNDYFDNRDYFKVSTTDSVQYEIILDGEASDIPSLLFCLRNLFGFEDFRDGQLPIIVNALRRRDTIGILPTGSGKSLCYQFVAMLQPCISFVVCPIVALMRDQKDNLDKAGITRTHYINSDMTGEEKGRVLTDFGKGRYLLLWISPERFQDVKFRNQIQSINKERNIALAVIDEVHCLSEWGHTFRTSYLNLVRTINNYCPEARLLGLTATASQFVLADLKREFQVDSDNIKTVSNISREELSFHLTRVGSHKMYDVLVDQLKRYKNKHGKDMFANLGNQTKSGIIFTANKGGDRGCIRLAAKLSEKFDINVETYHGDLRGDDRRDVQDGFKNNEFPLLTATKAFGMGIDKPNIRYTIHFGMPGSIETFYQEAGRAGRDKQKAQCTILYQGEDVPDDAINKLFDLHTEIQEIREIQKTLKNDIRSILYLWLDSNKGIEDDLLMMEWVMEQIEHPSKTQNAETILVKCDTKHKKADVEKAIYKLTLLGFIRDWTIAEWDAERGGILVEKEEYTEQTVKDHFFQVIKRYDTGFDEKNEEYQKYLTILSGEKLKPYHRYMKILLMWSYDNIVYQRRQAIKTMWDACENYKDGTTLATYIENYFRFSDSTLTLDQIANKTEDFGLLFDILFEQGKRDVSITRNEAEKLLPSLQRYIESYRYSIGLNYLIGMVRLICDKFHDPDGLPRLEDAFNRILASGDIDLDMVIDNTLKIGSTVSEEGREQLGDFLINKFPERALQINDALSDNASLLWILCEASSKLKRVKEKIKW